VGAVIFILGAVVGAVLGVIASVLLQATFERWAAQIQAKWRHFRRTAITQPQDLQAIGLIQGAVWSSRRPLDPDRQVVIPEPWPEGFEQRWFPSDVWAEALASATRAVSGDVCSIADYRLDTGEAGEESKSFRLTVRPSLYAESVAVQSLCHRDDCWQDLSPRLAADLRGELAIGPPQSLFIALTVSTAHGDVLALRRSGAVATASGLWSLGLCETMKAIPTEPGEAPETLFQLAYRAALEEAGLKRQELGPIWFSWFGFARSDGPFVVAHSRTSLDAVEIERRLLDSEGGYESDGIRWIHARSEEMKKLCDATQHLGWVKFNPVVARGVTRLEPYLDILPHRR
jgi:hypothetical protein